MSLGVTFLKNTSIHYKIYRYVNYVVNYNIVKFQIFNFIIYQDIND